MTTTVEENPTTESRKPLFTRSEIMSALVVYIVATVVFFVLLGYQNIVDLGS